MTKNEMMDLARRNARARGRALRFISGLSYMLLAFAILAKVAIANDLAATFAEDPLELWVALGVAFLLMARGRDELRVLDEAAP